VIHAQHLAKHPKKKEKEMNPKKVGIFVLIVALLSIGFAQNSFKGIGKPLPKPVPTSCPGDMSCW
jgi:hypothetical protein